MNDVEHDLRELFDQKASSVGGVAPRLPEQVRKRSRRRELGTAFVGGLTALALVVGSVAVVRSVDLGGDDRTAVDDPWAGYQVFERTATIGTFTITSPSDWYLVNQWPWASRTSSRLREARERASEACPDEPTREERRACRQALPQGEPGDGWVAPIAMLSLQDQGLTTSPCFDPSFRVGAEDAVMTLALDRVYMIANFGAGDLPRWPVPVAEAASYDRPSCGPGTYVPFGAGDIPYVAHFAFGDAVSDEERQALVDTFESMTVDESADFFMEEPDPSDSGAYVIAGGENAAGPWTLELRPQTEPGYVTNVELELSTAEGSGVRAGGPFTVGRDRPIEQAGGDPVFGAVVKEAEAVELRLEEGTPPIPAQIVPLPPGMPFDFDLFFASNDADVQAIAVALGGEGTPLPDASPARCEAPTGRPSRHTVTPTSGPSGSSAVVRFAIPTESETGHYVPPHGDLQLWWNLDSRAWDSALPGGDLPKPDRPGDVQLLRSFNVAGLCVVDASITIPRAEAGTYAIWAILITSDGASPIFPEGEEPEFTVQS
jgi:hypothetical protein